MVAAGALGSPAAAREALMEAARAAQGWRESEVGMGGMAKSLLAEAAACGRRGRRERWRGGDDRRLWDGDVDASDEDGGGGEGVLTAPVLSAPGVTTLAAPTPTALEKFAPAGDAFSWLSSGDVDRRR